MQKPSLGRIVIAKVDPRQNNGSDEAPAIIVAVNHDDTVNVRALLNGDDDLWLTHVTLTDERPEEDDEDIKKNVSGVQRVAFWPPRN